MKSRSWFRKDIRLSRNIVFTGLTSFLDRHVGLDDLFGNRYVPHVDWRSKASLGLIEGVAESTASLVKAFSGFWSDRIGKNKPFMLVGYAVSAIIFPLYAFVVSPMHVLILRFMRDLEKE